MIRIYTFTYAGDAQEAVACVRCARTALPEAVVTVVDDSAAPVPPEARRALVAYGARYRRSSFPRCGNLRGPECVRGIIATLAGGAADGDTVVKLSGMRKVVAERMLQSHTEIPPVTQNTKVDVTELMKFRKDLLAKTGKKYSVNDLVLKATAKVLRQHPEILVSYDGNQMIQHTHVNLGMAVALDAGLIVPVIRDADKMGLDELSATAKDLATRAKENKLTPDEYKGSTFSVSNLGMFGIETFTPIVNQPNAAILGVCSIEDELQMDDEGNISKHQVMRLSFTLDHRLMDGAVAAKFAMDLRDLLQSPLNILL